MPTQPPTITVTQPSLTAIQVEEMYAGPDGNVVVESEIALQGVSEYDVLSSVRVRDAIKREIRDALDNAMGGGILGSIQVFLTHVGNVPRDSNVAAEGELYIQFSVYRHSTSEAIKNQIVEALTRDTTSSGLSTISRTFNRELSLGLIERLRLTGTSLQTFNVIVSAEATSVGETTDTSTPELDVGRSSASADDTDEDDVFEGASAYIFAVLMIVIAVGTVYVLKVKGIAANQFEAIASCFGKTSGGADLPTVVDNPAASADTAPKTIEM